MIIYFFYYTYLFFVIGIIIYWLFFDNEGSDFDWVKKF